MNEIYLQEIRDFLNSEEIPYIESDTEYGLFYLNDKTIEVRYIDSYKYPIDNSKRFGDKCKGVDVNHFIDISHSNFDKGVRTIWIFDFEMEQHNDVVIDGVEIKGYRRQWEVIKNTIRTACGKIKYRFFARDCEIREIPKHEVRPFLEANCFYGYRAANVNLGLYLKKDKFGFKKGTLLFMYTFGYNFYGNKKHQDNPTVEVIRASTKIGCQVIGGISKCIKHFCEEYPKMKIGDKEVDVKRIVFYVDASHNDSRGMRNSNSAFKFTSWKGSGFMNRWTCDYDGSQEELEENKTPLKGKKGEIFHRKPMFHRHIMRLIGEGKIISIANAGTIVYEMDREEFIKNLE